MWTTSGVESVGGQQAQGPSEACWGPSTDLTYKIVLDIYRTCILVERVEKAPLQIVQIQAVGGPFNGRSYCQSAENRNFSDLK